VPQIYLYVFFDPMRRETVRNVILRRSRRISPL
jgi:hypothetical protein